MNEQAQSPVVSVAWLQAHLADAAVVVVDCRFALSDRDLGRRQYEAGHIPGAVYLDLERDLSGPVATHGGRHPLPDVATLSQKLAAIGVNSAPPTLVVAYDDSRLAFAARLWWLLRYLGHDRVAVLDGGLSAWKDAGFALETTVPQPTPGHFVPQVRSPMVVERETVIQRQEDAAAILVDSRQGDRYRGEQEPIDPIAGHIPGAVNYPWREVTQENGVLRSLAEHQQRWQSLRAAANVMVYCGSGVTACVNLLSLSLAGRTDAQLYVGSWSDWCSYSDAAIATGPNP